MKYVKIHSFFHTPSFPPVLHHEVLSRKYVFEHPARKPHQFRRDVLSGFKRNVKLDFSDCEEPP
jgi:hypothetical protein